MKALQTTNAPHSSRPPVVVHSLPLASAQRCSPCGLRLLFVLLGLGLVLSASGQTPTVLWSTNVGATAFAVDEQTNIFANSGGTVIKLTGAGVPIQTNLICPLPGIARADAAGNFYFAGWLTSCPDFFGGTVQCKGDAFYIAKCTSAGALVWAKSFESHPTYPKVIRDLQVTASGIAYVLYNIAYTLSEDITLVVRFDETGTEKNKTGYWRSYSSITEARLGGVTETNGYMVMEAIEVPMRPGTTLTRFDSSGVLTHVTDCRGYSYYAHPVRTSDGGVWLVEGSQLTRRNANGEIVRQIDRDLFGWLSVAPDPWDGVYLTSSDGRLSRYDSDGGLVWTLSFPASCTDVVADAKGNRILALSDATIVRLGTEPSITSPVITNAPQDQTLLWGDRAALSVGVLGETSRYQWLRGGELLPGATNAVLDLGNATTALSGLYSVIVTNWLGAVTSAPARLRVKFVQLYVGSQMLTNSTYAFATNPTVTVRSVFPSGSRFYTLNGSPPSFMSTPCTGPLTITRSSTVRAIGYSADFLQSDEADPVSVVLLQKHRLSVSSSGGGSVSLNPPGGSYLTGDQVEAKATPAPGWMLLQWLGDATGSDTSVDFSMDRDKTIRAVFGTTLSATTAGNGQVVLDPPGGVYPYGTSVRLTAVPAPGNYFGVWGNAASGNLNPLTLTILSPTQTVSSVFGTTPANQAEFTVRIIGRGSVNVNPRANVYAVNDLVTLTAVPAAGQNFVNWSGDAGGTQNPLAVALSAAKIITANFTGGGPALCVDRRGLEGMVPEGFRFTLVSQPLSVFGIRASTNLVAWDPIATLTNRYGEVQFLDTNAPACPQRFYQVEP